MLQYHGTMMVLSQGDRGGYLVKLVFVGNHLTCAHTPPVQKHFKVFTVSVPLPSALDSKFCSSFSKQIRVAGLRPYTNSRAWFGRSSWSGLILRRCVPRKHLCSWPGPGTRRVRSARTEANRIITALTHARNQDTPYKTWMNANTPSTLQRLYTARVYIINIWTTEQNQTRMSYCLTKPK